MCYKPRRALRRELGAKAALVWRRKTSRLGVGREGLSHPHLNRRQRTHFTRDHQRSAHLVLENRSNSLRFVRPPRSRPHLVQRVNQLVFPQNRPPRVEQAVSLASPLCCANQIRPYPARHRACLCGTRVPVPNSAVRDLRRHQGRHTTSVRPGSGTARVRVGVRAVRRPLLRLKATLRSARRAGIRRTRQTPRRWMMGRTARAVVA